MGHHADVRKWKVVKTMVVDDATRKLLGQKFRLVDTIEKRISQLMLSVWEEIDAMNDEGWEIVAKEFGYASLDACRGDHKRLNVNWHTGEIMLTEERSNDED